MTGYKSPADRDPTGLFFVPPVEKGFFNDQGCCGPIGIGIVLSVGIAWWAVVNSYFPERVVAAIIAIGVVAVVVHRVSFPPRRTPPSPPELAASDVAYGVPGEACARCSATAWQQITPLGERFGGPGATFRCTACDARRSFRLVDGHWTPVFDHQE